MPTVEIKFGPGAMKRALAESDGRHPSSAPLVLRDPGETGLTIRVSGKSAGWFLKWNGKFKRLGGVGSPDVKTERRESGFIYTGKDAAELGGRVREMMKLGLDVDAYLAARALGVGHEQANATGSSIAARASGAWTFATLAEQFIAERISKPTIKRNGSIKPEKPKTIKEVRAILRHPDVVAALDKKLARDVHKRDVEAIRQLWWNAGAQGRQQKLIAYVKSAYTWAKQHHSAAQLDDVAPWWAELRHHAYASKAEIEAMQGKAPTPPLSAADVAMILHVAERNRVAPERKIYSETTEIAISALWWVALTAQRTHAAFQATIARIDDRTEQEGWYEVSWLPVDMKAGRHFTLAVPPIVFDRTIARALLDPHRRKDSVWVFPSSRMKLRGQEGYADKPIGDTILNNLLGRLRGLKDGKTVGEDKLAAAGLPHFTLHELRDALATHLTSNTSLPGAAASAILDHAASEDEGRDTKEATVTRDHYNKSQRLALKFAGLSAWAEAIVSEYEEIDRKLRGKRSPLARKVDTPRKKLPKRVAERSSAHFEALFAGNTPAARPQVKLDLAKLGVAKEEKTFEPHEAFETESD